MVAGRSVSYLKLLTLPTSAAEQILALDCSHLVAPAGPLPPDGITHRVFSNLNAELLAELEPTVVLMPLFCTHLDALEMIHALEALAFTGSIIVVAPYLPRPKLVERELRVAGPGARLTLVTPETAPN